MPTSRRRFLKLSAAMGGALGFGRISDLALAVPSPSSRRRSDRREAAPKALDILILGGTGFTGPEQVEYALARGHRVTLFNRNKTRPGLFTGKVTELVGDLNDNVAAL